MSRKNKPAPAVVPAPPPAQVAKIQIDTAGREVETLIEDPTRPTKYEKFRDGLLGFLDCLEAIVVWCAVLILAYHCFWAIYAEKPDDYRKLLRQILEILQANWIGALILSGLLFYRLVCFKIRRLRDWSGKSFDGEKAGGADYDKRKVSAGVEL